MKKDDKHLLQEMILKSRLSAECMEQIGSRADKEMADCLSKEVIHVLRLQEKSLSAMVEQNGSINYNYLSQEKKEKKRIKRSTLFNTSHTHLAEIVIKDNMNYLADIWTAMKKYENASPYVIEIAREFTDFEEEMIEKMKTFL